MIRTADAAGIDAVVLGKGCADAFNPKTVRSTQGSLFHIPVVKRRSCGMDRLVCKRINVPVYGTALENAVLYSEVKKDGPFALIMGNEGNGIHPDLLAKTDVNVIIPIYRASGIIKRSSCSRHIIIFFLLNNETNIHGFH